MTPVEQLAYDAGLSRSQAEGVIGAVARLASGRLSPELYAELNVLIPGLPALIAAAPQPSGMAALLGAKAGLASVLNQLGIPLAKAGAIGQALRAQVETRGSPELRAALATLL